MLHGHGDNGYNYQQEIVADFSSNVWYGSEPAGLKEYLFDQWRRVNRYPEVMAESLTKKISIHHGLTPDNILVCNGATESMYIIAQAFSNKRSGIVIPSFSEYEDACSMHGHILQFSSWKEWTANGPMEGMDLWWLGNPNNPTGAVIRELNAILQHHPRTLFVVDEAFIEFTREIPSAIPLIAAHPHLVILRSLTKAFSIPGLRLGYIIADKAVIGLLRRSKQPWSVNAMALEAGHFIFDHYEQISLPLDQLLADKAAFIPALQDAGITVHDSHTHFFLCETSHGSATQLQQWLVDEEGILIRDAANFRGLGEKHFRLATLSPDKNQLLINALKRWQQQRA